MTQVEAADFVTLLRSSFSALEVRPPYRSAYDLMSCGVQLLSVRACTRALLADGGMFTSSTALVQTLFQPGQLHCRRCQCLLLR